MEPVPYTLPKPEELAVPLYVALMLTEIAIGRLRGTAKYETRDTLSSLAMGAGSLVAGVLAGLAIGGAYVWAWQNRMLDWGWAPWVFAVAFILDDFRYYWLHRIGHECRWFWASHVNHHSSQHYNLSTALRQTWTGTITGSFLFSLPLVFLGFHPLIVAFVNGLNLVYQFWIHTEAIKRMPRWFEAVMNTPSHHRVHHATNPKYLDANYAGVLIVWDKLFGTFVPEDDAEPCRYGIIKNLGTFNVLRIAFHEWNGLIRDQFQPDLTWRDRFLYIFGPPGWSHDASRQTSASIKADHLRRHPDLAGSPGLPSRLAPPVAGTAAPAE